MWPVAQRVVPPRPARVHVQAGPEVAQDASYFDVQVEAVFAPHSSQSRVLRARVAGAAVTEYNERLRHAGISPDA